MAGAPAGLPAGIRLSDHISLGVIGKTFPPDRVRQVLAETGKESERERDLPAQVMVYYAIALTLYMTASTREVLRCLLEGLRWLWGAEAVKVAGRSGISQARSRLGGWKQCFQPAAPALRGTGAADRHRRQQGGVVPRLAAGQPGRQLPGRGRHRGEPRRVWGAGGRSRRERLPAAAPGGAGRERHARAVRRASRPPCRGRGDAGPGRAG